MPATRKTLLLLHLAQAGALCLLWRRHLAFEKAMRRWGEKRDSELLRFAEELNDDWTRFAREVNAAFKRAGAR